MQNLTKYKKVFYSLLISTILLACFPLAAFAYPLFTANADIVECGGYLPITSGTANWPGIVNTEWHFLSLSNELRIRQAGIIDHFSLNLDSITNITHFYIEIWRKNPDDTFNRLYQEDFIASIATGINNYTPSTSWSVIEGDYIGYGYLAAPATRYIMTKTPVGGTTYFVQGSAPTTPNYTWPNSSANAVVIKAYMQTAPQLVFIGDSLTAGYPANNSLIEHSLISDITSTTSYQLSLLYPYTYQNMGIISQETTDLVARFTADVIDLHPRVVVLEGGINDIRHTPGQTKAQFLIDWTAMLDAAQANGIIPIVMLMYPGTSITNTQMQTRDDWNASLASLASTYTNAIIVNVDPYVGQFRAGGDPGNLWDYVPAYTAEGLHLTLAGDAQIAQAIKDSLPKPSATFDNDFSAWNAGSITVNYNLIQLGGNITTNISQTGTSGIEYSTDGSTWFDATQGVGGDAMTGLTSTNSPGTDHSFVLG